MKDCIYQAADALSETREQMIECVSGILLRMSCPWHPSLLELFSLSSHSNLTNYPKYRITTDSEEIVWLRSISISDIYPDLKIIRVYFVQVQNTRHSVYVSYKIKTA